MKVFETIYPVCRSLVAPDIWERVEAACSGDEAAFSESLLREAEGTGMPRFLPDLSRLERAVYSSAEQNSAIPAVVDEITVNPTLHLLQVSWKNLPSLLLEGKGAAEPEAGEEMLIVWRNPATGKVMAEVPSAAELLALKIVIEGVDADGTADDTGRPVGVADTAIQNAVRRGILLSPPSKIQREIRLWPECRSVEERFTVSQGFTLQWHITQACDLHCRHCYDRSSRRAIPFEKALALLDDLRRFCRRRFVSGHVSFTGGNPLMHPRFFDLYQAAADRGFTASILGNPSSREDIERIVSIEHPYLFQVSLEGLEEHNDAIRGPGHFRKVMDFLPLLREYGISSMIMLTLTEGNIDQILPLAERLEGVVDDFTFNRLSMVGEGENLRLPSKERYEAFLEEYTNKAEGSAYIGIKDNLINIIRHRRGEPLFGGCTGFGCGAAFNFISVLAEGEAHGCRKFPSPIGNVLENGIEGVYESGEARRYREGCASCARCGIRHVCGGCLAVSSSYGGNPFTDRDPQCFIAEGEG